jgi:hypothetical protein
MKLLLLIIVGLAGGGAALSVNQRTALAGARLSEGRTERLSKLVEANIIATHAHEVLLAKKSNKGDAACYSPGRLSDTELEALVARQGRLLASNKADLAAWVRGEKSTFLPARELEPILSSSLTIPDNAPVNLFASYLRQRTKASTVEARAVASLYQTVLEVERDGDLLQQQFAFYIALGLPVYTGQFKLQGSDESLLAMGRELEAKSCASPFETTAAAWQIAGRKIWNWGEKNLHLRDEKVLAAELLREPEVRALVPKIRNLPQQRIAVIGHSFTMGLHWSSPSSFVPVVMEIFRRKNPRAEFKQFAAGGLTSSRARQRFFQDALAWKPDKVFVVVMNRREEDFEALRQMGEDFIKAGAQVFIFDNIQDPAAINSPETVKRTVDVARAAGIGVIEVGDLLSRAPERASFLSLDRIHMTEPYHRLMAKEWLRFLTGVRGAKLEAAGAPPRM